MRSFFPVKILTLFSHMASPEEFQKNSTFCSHSSGLQSCNLRLWIWYITCKNLKCCSKKFHIIIVTPKDKTTLFCLILYQLFISTAFFKRLTKAMVSNLTPKFLDYTQRKWSIKFMYASTWKSSNWITHNQLVQIIVPSLAKL